MLFLTVTGVLCSFTVLHFTAIQFLFGCEMGETLTTTWFVWTMSMKNGFWVQVFFIHLNWNFNGTRFDGTLKKETLILINYNNICFLHHLQNVHNKFKAWNLQLTEFFGQLVRKRLGPELFWGSDRPFVTFWRSSSYCRLLIKEEVLYNYLNIKK